MVPESQILVIDAGNTAAKTGHFQGDTLLEVKRFANSDYDKLYAYIDQNSVDIAVLASVRSEEDTKKIMDQVKCFRVTSETPVPITNAYESIHTLGVDRLCNAVAAYSMLQSDHGVVIDIGTCIKFDVVSKEGVYLGGSIAPGIELRYKALNDYTGKLPLLSNKTATNIVGKDTRSSIQSGVINGMNAEINGLMKQYRADFKDLTFFVTGGDAGYFEFDSKNDIFADENLTLKGLFEIYKHNA